MRFKRSHVSTALILVLVGAYYYLWVFRSGDVFSTSGRNAPNRESLLRVRGAIELGASHAEVLAAYWSHRTDDLRLTADSPTGWLVHMPSEFGAGDWVLTVKFRDGRVTAVRVITSDGPPPKDGPPDKHEPAA